MSTAFNAMSGRKLHAFQSGPLTKRTSHVRCQAMQKGDQASQTQGQSTGRRDFMLKSSSFGTLAAIFGFSFGDSKPPSGIGLKDYGDENKQLGLCPRTPPCVSTAEVMNNDSFFIPPWTYNPTIGKRRKNPITKDQAMAELKEVVSTLKPDNFEPTIEKETSDYLYVTYKSPVFGFVDDVEFYFPAKNSEVEYRSASRIGERDFDINRKRIRAIRKELEKKGWLSAGY